MPNPCSAQLVWLQPEQNSQENGKKIAKPLAAPLFDAMGGLTRCFSLINSFSSSPSAPFPEAGVADNLHWLDSLSLRLKIPGYFYSQLF